MAILGQAMGGARGIGGGGGNFWEQMQRKMQGGNQPSATQQAGGMGMPGAGAPRPGSPGSILGAVGGSRLGGGVPSKGGAVGQAGGQLGGMFGGQGGGGANRPMGMNFGGMNPFGGMGGQQFGAQQGQPGPMGGGQMQQLQPRPQSPLAGAGAAGMSLMSDEDSKEKISKLEGLTNRYRAMADGGALDHGSAQEQGDRLKIQFTDPSPGEQREQMVRRVGGFQNPY